MGQKRIMILGAGVMQIPSIKIAKGKGWFVLAADGNDKAEGREFADAFEHVDLKDREGLAACAARYKKEGGLDGVFTAGTDFSSSVAWVAERLGLPGISFKAALNASMKSRMRKVLKEGGVPVPRFACVTTLKEARTAAESLGFPLVVKPVDNMGARGCRKIGDLRYLEEACSEALAYSRSGTAILEDFLDGPEYSVDALVAGGRIAIRGLADRHIMFSPYFIEIGHTLPAKIGLPERDEVLRVFEAGVRALGIDRGAAKGDVKLTAKGAFIGEIAARLSGGYMSGWTYPYASGIEVTSEALDIAIGEIPSFEGSDSGKTSAERAVISIPGIVAAIKGLDEARRIPLVRDLFLRTAPGDPVVFPSNNVEKCGNVISSGEERDSAVFAAESAVREILIELAPANERTESFLAGKERIFDADGAYPPDAFSLRNHEIARLIAGLPEYDSRSPEGRISIRPIPALKEEGTEDWHGRSLSGTLDLIARRRNVEFSPAGGTVLSGRFWRSLIRGGYQAGLYVIDTELTRSR